ncbi:class I SAM-dependent methyltransferase [Lacibacterium aquatile]|uniref:Class I SAM-dependent methyltransferase n=1 Tax=Lacibacterium aquatile TaxID=1168082 RepID=A0ABW5DWQ2_9PROT
MEANEYAKMAAWEDEFWWFQALRDNQQAFLPDGPLKLLDAGCGTGGWLKRLADTRPDISCVGLEYDPGAAVIARQKSGAEIYCGSVNGMPFAPASFDIVTSSDVLCHVAVEEGTALDEFARVLKPGGALLMNLPAYQWMLSAHDHRVHNARRYYEGGVRKLLAAHGFRVQRASYWNSALFPLMAAKRLLSPKDAGSDVARLPPLVEASFRAATRAETAILKTGCGLPFGGSLMVLARKV